MNSASGDSGESTLPETMSDMYHQLLDAAIDHLRDLKNRGEKFVHLAPETLKSLKTIPAAGSARAPQTARPTSIKPAGSQEVSASTAPRKTAAPAQPLAVSTPAIPAAIPNPAMETAPPGAPKADATAGMEALRQRILACQKCPHLASSRKTVVFGVGDPNSPLMFVGEAPGADEDAQGEPFVGKAGQLLTKIIQAMGFTRETVFIANILKCRPDTPGQDSGNRKPTPEEMATCIPHLLEQIQLIQPKVIVALGATAVEGLFGKIGGITRLRGQWHDFRGTPVMPTYHPAYLLRNQSLATKREVWEDMLKVLEKLDCVISDKQRQFFTKAA
jgi:DNA polymerase